MKLYQFEHNLYTGCRNPITMTEYEAVEKQKSYEVQNRHGVAKIKKSDIGQLNTYGNTVYLLEPDWEKAKTLFLSHLKVRLEMEEAALQRTQNYYQKLSKFHINVTGIPFDDMVQALRDYITSVSPIEAYDIVEDILGREIEFDEELLNVVETLWDLPTEKIQEAYNKYCKPQVITR